MEAIGEAPARRRGFPHFAVARGGRQVVEYPTPPYVRWGQVQRVNTPVLDVEHLGVTVEGIPILRHLTFSVAPGTLLAVVGPNGCGKTMLFRALIGVVPHSGTVRWGAGVRMAYVPQKLDLERNLPITAGDLLAARRRVGGIAPGETQRALDRVGLAPRVLDQLVDTLSGGQFQRLLMALALLGDPNVLLLDEPTAGVDEPGQERLNTTVQRLVRDGVTVLMISHDSSTVSRFATAVLCLTHDHRSLGVRTEVITAEMLTEMYGEPVAPFAHDPRTR